MLGKLTLENEFLKRPCRTPSNNKRKKIVHFTHKELIEAVRRGCELMNIPPTSFYYRSKEKSLEQLKVERDLAG